MREVLELVDSYLSIRELNSPEFEERARQMGYVAITYMDGQFPIVLLRKAVTLGNPSEFIEGAMATGYVPSTLTVYDWKRNYAAILNRKRNVIAGWRQTGGIGELLYPHLISDNDVPILSGLAESIGMQPELPRIFQEALGASSK
ncbi:MAG: hypothetical protein HY365_02400 [Candidatus Aenigmarchaeota archaeon]|nr:hypothetical protein [Candidatus Aenigmarchaeota archaeon]